MRAAASLQPRGERLDETTRAAEPPLPQLSIDYVRDGSRYQLESGAAFSESLLWKLQRHYYRSRGVDAWGNGEVPAYVTSNPTVAQQYAAMTFAAMRDSERASRSPQRQIVLELGAGSGRFAFLFLRYFTQLCERDGIGEGAFLYVMSDFSEKNIRSWQTHPQLQEYFERGILETAHVDLCSPGDIDLQRSGDTISPGSLELPPVVIANYVFDALPQDLFHVKDGRLHECRVALYANAEPEARDAAALLDSVECEIAVGTLAHPYANAAWDTVLETYCRLFDGGYVCFPSGALRAVDYVRTLCAKGAIVLAADKGDHRPFALRELFVAHHGSISLEVDFYAMAQHCAAAGGTALFSDNAHSSIDVCAFVFVPGNAAYASLERAFREALRFGPDEFHNLCGHAKNTSQAMSVHALAAYLRLARYDSDLLARFLPVLVKKANAMTAEEKAIVTSVAERCWESHFTVGTNADLAFDLGVLFHEMGEQARALEFFAASSRHAGLRPGTMFNSALCFGRLGRTNQERALLEQLLALAPEYAPALERLAELR